MEKTESDMVKNTQSLFSGNNIVKDMAEKGETKDNMFNFGNKLIYQRSSFIYLNTYITYLKTKRIVTTSRTTSDNSISTRSITNNSIYGLTGNMDTWRVNNEFSLRKKTAWGDNYYINVELKYEKGSIDNSESNSIMYMRPSADSICKYMAEENTDRTKYDYLVNGKYNFYFPSGMQIDLGYTYRQANITENRLRLRDFVDDNSYHSSAMTRQNIPFISLAYQRRKLNVTIGIELPLVSENMSYHKSLVDTIVHRTYTDFSPNLTIGWGNRRHYLRVNSKFGTTRRPSINDLVNTTDDSNPLMILKGNGGLKKESSFDIDINLSITNPNRDFTSSLQSSVRMLFNNITQSEYYNSESGAYTFMPVNVNGTLITTNKFSIGTAFDKKRLFR